MNLACELIIFVHGTGLLIPIAIIRHSMALWTLQMKLPTEANLPALLRDWREDTMNFLRHDAPKIVLVVLIAYILTKVLRAVARKSADLHVRRLPPGVSVQQVRTVASVLTSVGVFVIFFVAALEVLSLLGLNLGPMLASAGIAGLAIGFGAQTLVKDFINGFFILLENQYDIGDTVRIAGVKGTVERMSLRNTVLRDDDGTVHIVPNSSIQIVSNTTRDWSQLALKITVAYSEPSDKIVKLLNEVGEEVRHDGAFAEDIVSDIQVPGIDRVGHGEAEYLMLIKTRPNKQYAVSRELRRRIKACFEKNNVQAAGPGRIYVMDQGTGKAS
jgi:moderate conductance mechanosensitive channel